MTTACSGRRCAPLRPSQLTDMGTTDYLASHPTGARVIRLWRYPVKSMLGEEYEYLDIDERGAKGDRLFAVRDVDGKFGSGKTTRRFRKIDGLFGFSAATTDDLPRITFRMAARSWPTTPTSMRRYPEHWASQSRSHGRGRSRT